MAVGYFVKATTRSGMSGIYILYDSPSTSITTSSIAKRDHEDAAGGGIAVVRGPGPEHEVRSDLF
jgi:hypothetical protein